MKREAEVRIGDIEIRAGKLLRVCLHHFKGGTYLNARLHYNKGGEWLPGKEGWTVSADFLPEIQELLARAASELEKTAA